MARFHFTVATNGLNNMFKIILLPAAGRAPFGGSGKP